MECKACGYWRRLEYVNREEVWTGGEKDFINIQGDFAIEDEETSERIFVALYACPKCKTIILDLDDN
jgi:hypothetical protein